MNIANQGIKQNIKLGTAPVFDNGSDTYIFRPVVNRIPGLEKFADSILQNLNFHIEKIHFKQANLRNQNQSYYILSSATNEPKVETLRERSSRKHLLFI